MPCYDAACVFMEMEAMGRARSPCLVVGPLTVARTHGRVAQASPSCRALGRGSDKAGEVGTWSIWQWQQQVKCIPRAVRAADGALSAVSSSLPTSEMTGP